MKISTIMVCFVANVLLWSCQPSQKNIEIPTPNAEDSLVVSPPLADNSETSLDWNGTYEALIPCADCPGIKVELTLGLDKTFVMMQEYLERNVVSEDKGTFVWDGTGSIITLNGSDINYKFKVIENGLIQLDLAGQEISGPNQEAYRYKKK